MKSILKFLSFIPVIDRLYKRKYFATGFGIYILNALYNYILGISRGGDFLLNFTSRVNSPKQLIVLDGENNSSVYLSLATSGGCYYQAINGIEIAEGTIWSNNCSFISANHSFTNLNEHLKIGKIKIGKYVWIGSNSVILPGVKVGDYSIIGAGSIVSKNILNYSVVAGNPSKLIAKRCKKCLDKISLKSDSEICNNCLS